MPLNEFPKYFSPETRGLIDSALEEAWQELSKDSYLEAAVVQPRLRSTIVALAAGGKTEKVRHPRLARGDTGRGSCQASAAERKCAAFAAMTLFHLQRPP